MPDERIDDEGERLPPALPNAMAEKPADEKVKQPDTPAERRKKRLELAVSETDDKRSERHRTEMHTHKKAHDEHIAEAHEAYPIPLDIKFEEMTSEQQRMWNDRRKTIDSANKAYYNAVRTTFTEHQAELAHVQREAAKAQENV